MNVLLKPEYEFNFLNDVQKEIIDIFNEIAGNNEVSKVIIGGSIALRSYGLLNRPIGDIDVMLKASDYDVFINQFVDKLKIYDFRNINIIHNLPSSASCEQYLHRRLNINIYNKKYLKFLRTDICFFLYNDLTQLEDKIIKTYDNIYLYSPFEIIKHKESYVSKKNDNKIDSQNTIKQHKEDLKEIKANLFKFKLKKIL